MNTLQNAGVILIVDDSPEALSILNEALAKEGYTILVAMDGTQALSITQRMLPDLVLMDALMPNMDGFEACQELKKRPEMDDVPVIFMTGLSDSEHVVKGLEAGGVDYITKPIILKEMLARIKVHLHTSRQTRSVRNALESVGQNAFACGIHGELLWTTAGAQELFNATMINNDWLSMGLPEQLRSWLSHNPKRHSCLNLSDLSRPLKAVYLNQPMPNEHVLRLVDDDELDARNALRDSFDLTERESEVLFWLARGKTNRDIAQILSMSARTVNKHLESIYRKLNVENRSSATAQSLQVLNAR